MTMGPLSFVMAGQRSLRKMILIGALAGGAIAAARAGNSAMPTMAAAGGSARAPAVPAPAAGSATTTAPRGAGDKESPVRGPAPTLLPHHVHGPIDLAAAHKVDDHYEIQSGGQTVILTLDPVMQEAAESVLARARPLQGAIVVMRPDGTVLALAGAKHPVSAKDGSPDPTLATRAWAPAASVFKLVTATALLGGGLSPNKKVCYHGGLRGIGPDNLVDNPRRDRRCDDLGTALAKSQNAIIAKLVHDNLKPAELRAWAEKLGLGKEPDFCVHAEACPYDIPDAPLDFARVAAGFWRTELSPLGAALLANTMATGGMTVEPRIVNALVDGSGNRHDAVTPAPHRAIPAKVAHAVAHMMVGTTEHGTARKGFHDRHGRPFIDVPVAGKTGTLTRGTPYMQYSWFVGFAPADKPDVVIAVLLGNPPKWHLKAHTAARLVLQRGLAHTK